MTYKEAYKWIKRNGRIFTFNCEDIDCGSATEQALKALEKQIPKKPVATKQYEYCTDHICPTCGADFEDRTMPYCLACGQKLEWD